jgi:hypothetical protein
MKMKKVFLILMLAVSAIANSQTNGFWEATTYKGAFPQTDFTPATDWTYGWSNFDPENTNYPQTSSTLSTDITTNTTIGGVVLLQNKVYVKNGATLTILPGTILRGDATTQGSLIVTRGSKIIAEGTENNPIVFTSNQSVGNRAEGDWGGLVILGEGINNQPGGVVNIEGITPTADTEHGGYDNDDNSGVIKYVRIEFAGIALEPNKEINGITFGSVGRGTLVDYVQVSFSGDDSFEWFGGAVNCKHLIAYKGVDDDFDTDFGFSGNVQFGLAVRTEQLSDAAGDSNCFESDNDAQGSSNLPQTSAVFSNFTIIGPRGNGSVQLPAGEKFEKAFRIRRNSSISIFNSIVTGWEKGLSIEGAPVELNITSGNLVFSNNELVEIPNFLVTATPQFYGTFFGVSNNDTLTTIAEVDWVDAFSQNADWRLTENSVCNVGADFTSPKFVGGFATISEQNELKLNIYPNPTSQLIWVNLPGENRLDIYNSLGKLVISTKTTDSTMIDLSNLHNGVYFVKVENITKTIIVNK